MRELQLAFISNRTTARLFRLLSTIERDRVFTIGDLAERNQVTQRTIANDIKYMKEYFGDSIAPFRAIAGLFSKRKSQQTIKKESKAC